MESFKGRQLDVGQRVRVYWNSQRKKFSVMDAKTSRVLGHTDQFAVRNGKFHVKQSGRERVRRERQKNVHAWVDGEFVAFEHDSFPWKFLGQARYSPYNDEHTGFYDDLSYDPLEGTFEVVAGYEGSVFYGENA